MSFSREAKVPHWGQPRSPAPYGASEPSEVQCSHVLVKHIGSRRPSSWREKSVMRSKVEAIAIVTEYRRQIIHKEAKFEEIAKTYSDCSSAKREGDLGYFKRGHMQKAFEDAAFALNVGQLSEVIDTDSGIHIILRTA